MHYAKQTYYSRIRRDSVCNTFQDPIITSVIDAKKITACGESGFPARFLGMMPVIPPHSNRKESADYDRHLYRERHLVECSINKIKHYHRIFSRFEKLDTRYLGFLHFTAALIWLR